MRCEGTLEISFKPKANKRGGVCLTVMNPETGIKSYVFITDRDWTNALFFGRPEMKCDIEYYDTNLDPK